MNDVQCGCLTYKYSLIAVILVPIICTLSMSLLVSLAWTVPTTINNRFRFSHDVLRCRSSASNSGIAKLLSDNVPLWQQDRLSDRRNMDRKQLVVSFVAHSVPRTQSFNTLVTLKSTSRELWVNECMTILVSLSMKCISRRWDLIFRFSIIKGSAIRFWELLSSIVKRRGCKMGQIFYSYTLCSRNVNISILEFQANRIALLSEPIVSGAKGTRRKSEKIQETFISHFTQR